MLGLTHRPTFRRACNSLLWNIRHAELAGRCMSLDNMLEECDEPLDYLRELGLISIDDSGNLRYNKPWNEGDLFATSQAELAAILAEVMGARETS